MDGPYTAVECPYCDEPEGMPCVSSGGYTFDDGAHAARLTLGRKLGRGNDPAQRLKLALWFIDKAGGPGLARKLFEAAATALELSDEEPPRQRREGRMKQILTREMRERLMWLLIDEGCACEGQHDEPEDATSLNCLAGAALHDLDEALKEIGRLKEDGDGE